MVAFGGVSLASGVALGGLGARPRGFSSAALAVRHFGFVLCRFGLAARVGPRLHFGLGSTQGDLAFLPSLDFVGDRQALLKRRGIGFFGLCQEFLDFQIEFLNLVLGVAVA